MVAVAAVPKAGWAVPRAEAPEAVEGVMPKLIPVCPSENDVEAVVLGLLARRLNAGVTEVVVVVRLPWADAPKEKPGVDCAVVAAGFKTIVVSAGGQLARSGDGKQSVQRKVLEFLVVRLP